MVSVFNFGIFDEKGLGKSDVIDKIFSQLEWFLILL